MKIFVAKIIPLLLIIVFSCSENQKGTFEIFDVSREAKFRITQTGGNNYGMLKTRIKGYADDAIQVGYEVYPGGVIDTITSTEVYENELVVTYKPLGAKNGMISIEY